MISIDTGVLLAILRGEEGQRQNDLLSLGVKYRLTICDAAFAELCNAFENWEKAETFLAEHSIRISMPSNAALCEAGRRFKIYLKKRKSLCPQCSTPIPSRGTTAVDFLVGALGLVDGCGIITNDKQIRRIWKEANFF